MIQKKINEEGNIYSNTAFFIFADGMDENLYFGNKFKDNLIILIYLLDLFSLNQAY